MHVATNNDDGGRAAFPEPGDRVRVRCHYETRMVGDDTQRPVSVPEGATGTVQGMVEEWCDVDVRLDRLIAPMTDGETVWLCPIDLDVETDAGWTPLNPLCKHCETQLVPTPSGGWEHAETGRAECLWWKGLPAMRVDNTAEPAEEA